MKTLDTKENIINEVATYYSLVDKQILIIVYNALTGMNLSKIDIKQAMILYAAACDKHFKRGYAISQSAK
ncbi:hypothetical protein [Pelosinus sp. IPA-1]|uniref:hypothetical protein n=1 Tax=Pelosinus sp. IPA-1 TaxID=3029569 RepID=UPI00243623B2|nr:hypothetical protein [Pelosinus sp. IPA-1]GMB00945.1 hypothetical protein PIPA1_37440 [Pelosinus sp. IPA-1]